MFPTVQSFADVLQTFHVLFHALMFFEALGRFGAAYWTNECGLDG